MELKFSRKIFGKFSNIKFPESRPLEAEFHAVGLTDIETYDESDGRFFAILRTRLKMLNSPTLER
jgi:hypothetical protein